MGTSLKYYTEGMPLPQFKIDDSECVLDILKANVEVVYGGDGSILRSAQRLVQNGVTDVWILGINTGHVGFLSNDIDKKRALDFLKNPDESLVEQRNMLCITHQGTTWYALNEIVVQPLKRGPLFVTNLKVDSDELVYKGDGVILSTPSGSTAYNLSAGGPILHPGTKVLGITPICPFSLAARPLVVPDTVVVAMDTTAEAEVTIDGVSVFTGVLQNMSASLAPFTINLIKFTSFFEAIHNKLGWNYSIR